MRIDPGNGERPNSRFLRGKGRKREDSSIPDNRFAIPDATVGRFRERSGKVRLRECGKFNLDSFSE